MKPEKKYLVHDLLDDSGRDARRAATLLAGGRILRRRRWRRVATRCLTMAVVVVLAVVGAHELTVPRRPASTVGPRILAVASPSPEVRFLSDDELLDLFPGTPVGLATVGGKKWLIFPRSGDEARFVSRLPDLPDHR